MANLKASLRQQFLSERQALLRHQRLRLDRRIGTFILRFLDDLDALRLAAFHPFRGEPDLIPAMEMLHQAGRRIYLPVILTDSNGNSSVDSATDNKSPLLPNSMQFCRWRPGTELVKNRYGIAEPRDGKVCPVQSLDVVFMPLVAFSATGARLGMGGGYYDRAFGDCAEQSASGPLRVGVAYGFQQIDSVPTDPWDVALDAVITERGCQNFSA